MDISHHPLISVVIPLYNKGAVISDTITSVLNQSFRNFEVIVIDDGSTDKGPKIVSCFDDERIHLFSQDNSGVSAARNMGVQKANANYIAFLDGDDYWSTEHLQQIADLIRDFRNVADLFSTNFYRCFPDGEKIINRTDSYRGLIKNYFKSISNKALIHTSCICISKRAFNSVGGFDTRFSIGEDINLWNRLCRRYRLAYSSEATSYYTIDAPNNSRRSKINYKKDAARVSLGEISSNPYDIYLSIRRFVKYCIKRVIEYQPRIRKEVFKNDIHTT